MEKTPHGLLCAYGADEFAEKHSLKLVESQKYFETDFRWKQLQMLKQVSFLISVPKLKCTVCSKWLWVRRELVNEL